MSAQTFTNRWLGKRTDQDGVYQFQCVDLILAYVKEEYGLTSGVWGNAIDYWTKPTAKLLTKFDKVASQSPKAGDIVVLNGLPGNPFGHIMIAVNPTTAIEQNGATGDGDGKGGDEIRYRTIPKNRIAGLLRPKATKPSASAQGGEMTKPEVEAVFKAYTKLVFGKPIDASGLANYVGHVMAGRYSFDKAFTEILNSPQAQAWLKKNYQTTKTVEKAVRDPADIAKITELGRALEVAQKSGGSPVDADDASKWRQFLSLLPFVKK